MASKAGRWTGAAAAVLGAAYLAFVVNEKRSEQPRYETEVEDGVFSIRRYPALLVAESHAPGDRQKAVDRGFRALARYIFGKDRSDADGRKIAMTAPVLAAPEAGGWRTRFVMPRAFGSADTLPRPGQDVRTATIPARRMAAVRFAGVAKDEELQAQERELRAWLLARGVRIDGPAEYAFYNSPFIVGPLRRNEVLIPLA